MEFRSLKAMRRVKLRSRALRSSFGGHMGTAEYIPLIYSIYGTSGSVAGGG
jgi:hypothetical protein